MNKTPAVRFKGFTEDWEQQKLEEISDVRDGTHDSPVYQDEGHPFVTSKNVKNGYINFDGIQYISDYDFFEINKRSKVDINDILMGMIGTIGNLALIRTEPNFAIKNVALIKDTKNVSYLYLYHYLKSSSIERQLLFGMDGGTQKFVSLKKIRELKIQIPDDDEQIKLGTFMESLDNLIVFYQRKYEKLVNIKKSMLYKMFPQNGSKVPEIRFTGFTDDWEQQAFEKAFDFLQNNTLSRAELNNENGVAKNVHYGDVLIKFGEYLDISNSVLPYITSQLVTNRFRSSILKNGDVVMADTAEDETVGKCTELAGISHYPIISGLHTIPLRPKIKFAAGYLGYYMNSSRYHNQLLPLIQGTKVSSISKNALKNTSILFPSKTDEQRLIGQFFIQLDDLIIFHQRKLEKLKQLKQAMLHKMFV